jgi:hypothetical protein
MLLSAAAGSDTLHVCMRRVFVHCIAWQSRVMQKQDGLLVFTKKKPPD